MQNKVLTTRIGLLLVSFFLIVSNQSSFTAGIHIPSHMKKHSKYVLVALPGLALLDGYYLHTKYVKQCKKNKEQSLKYWDFIKKLTFDSKFRSAISGSGLFTALGISTVVAGVTAGTNALYNYQSNKIYDGILRQAIGAVQGDQKLQQQLAALPTKKYGSNEEIWLANNHSEWCLWGILVKAIEQDNLELCRLIVPHYIGTADQKPYGLKKTVAQLAVFNKATEILKYLNTINSGSMALSGKFDQAQSPQPIQPGTVFYDQSGIPWSPQPVPQPLPQNSQPSTLPPLAPVLFYNKKDLYYEFTNFFPINVTIKIPGIGFKTCTQSEGAFQICKYIRNNHVIINGRQIIDAVKFSFDTYAPKRAYTELNNYLSYLDPQWHNMSLYVMYAVVKAKFEQNPILLTMLSNTESRELIENTATSQLQDSTWGNAKNGKNWLGKILMKVRKELCGKPYPPTLAPGTMGTMDDFEKELKNHHYVWMAIFKQALVGK